MDADFWKRVWAEGEIGFHESKPNPLMVAHYDGLTLEDGSRVFLPLCGKTLDIAWLLAKGYRVVGVELSKLAIEQLFIALGVEPEVTECGRASRYSATNIELFVGDIFSLSSEDIGTVDAIYDRAALVALPKEMRNRYTRHLLDITGTAEQLLITFEYDQTQMDGPPFSLNSDEVNRHYGDVYNVRLLESIPIPGGLKGKCAATEHIWLLKND
jgi:thiopurine S-methyltransferase